MKLGRVTSQAFRPTPKDQHKLSVYDGDQVTPSASYKHYVGRRLESAGVMAVTVEECAREGLDARPSPEVFKEHAEIDFSGLNSKQCETKGKKLRSYAESRGWLFRAEEA